MSLMVVVMANSIHLEPPPLVYISYILTKLWLPRAVSLMGGL